MPIPDYQSLMLPVLRVAGREATHVADCIERLAKEFTLTEEECGRLMPTGQQPLFASRVHWALTYLAHARLIQRPRRGYFTIAERGQALLRESPVQINNALLTRYEEFNEWTRRNQQGRGAKGSLAQGRAEMAELPFEIPIERAEANFRELMATLQDDLLDRVLQVTPAFFEALIVDLLVAMGYGGSRKEAGRTIGRSGDGGVDGVIDEDPLGLNVLYVQAKRYQPEVSVGRPAVQAFAGSLDGVSATKGVLVTTSKFTRDARQYAERIQKRIILIDGAELTRLLTQYNVGVRVGVVYELKRIDEGYFGD